MLGNVLEWTSARIVDNEEESMPDLYILKGGSWATGGIVSAARRFIESETWSNIIGFRCAV
jgi:formylglycine-generating enzyme required for sulfatase activity